MSDENDSGQDRTEDPTEKRKKDYREKGKTAQSKDLASVGVLLMVGLATAGWWPSIVTAAQEVTIDFLGDGPANVELFMQDPLAIGKLTVKYTLFMVMPIIGAAVVAGLLLAIGQVGLQWTWKPLAPDANRLDPIKGLQNKLFSMQAVFEWLKAMAKVAVIAVVSWKMVKIYAPKLPELAGSSLRDSVGWTGGIIARLVFFCLLGMLVLGIADLLFAKWQLLRKMRMTRQELKEENKEMEGDPYMKARVRRIMAEMSRNALVADVTEATVVVANPTHYAVAIKYQMGQAGPPMVVARGRDVRAQKIKEIARSNNIPRIENRRLARALYADCRAGDEVPPDMYEAVAEVLAFVYRLRESRRPKPAPAVPASALL